MSQVSSSAAFHALLCEFCAIYPSARFILPSIFAILPICIVFYFAGTVRGREDSLSDIILQYRICTAARWKISLFVIEALVAKFVAREHVPLLAVDANVVRNPAK